MKKEKNKLIRVEINSENKEALEYAAIKNIRSIRLQCLYYISMLMDMNREEIFKNDIGVFLNDKACDIESLSFRVPESVHQKLKSLARSEGRTISYCALTLILKGMKMENFI